MVIACFCHKQGPIEATALGPQFPLEGQVIAGVLQHNETGSLQPKRSICLDMIAFFWIIGRPILRLCISKSSRSPTEIAVQMQ